MIRADILVLEGQRRAGRHAPPARRKSCAGSWAMRGCFLATAMHLTRIRRWFRYGFELTDGVATYQASFVDIESGQRPMFLFIGALPPADQDLWVLSFVVPTQADQLAQASGGTICFAPQTKIRTPGGDRLVKDLGEGDRNLHQRTMAYKPFVGRQVGRSPATG